MSYIFTFYGSFNSTSNIPWRCVTVHLCGHLVGDVINTYSQPVSALLMTLFSLRRPCKAVILSPGGPKPAAWSALDRVLFWPVDSNRTAYRVQDSRRVVIFCTVFQFTAWFWCVIVWIQISLIENFEAYGQVLWLFFPFI